jgi:hypothetical protein
MGLGDNVGGDLDRDADAASRSGVRTYSSLVGMLSASATVRSSEIPTNRDKSA